MTTTESTSKKVAVIIGSTRVKRVGADVAKFILDIAVAAEPSIEFSLLDIATFKLPVWDEPDHPATVPVYGGKYIHDHTIAWTSAIAGFDGYIFLTAEYNFGTPGAVKNAIDYVYNEWKGKPIFVISYGIQGGKNAGDSLITTFKGVKLDVVENRVALKFPGDNPIAGLNKSVTDAMHGILSKETLEIWDGDHKAEIVKGVEELKAKLLAPPTAA